jgi:hypothetical protein
VDRRHLALVLLLSFVACTGVAIVVSGSRPASAPGLAPVVLQGLGYLLGLVAAALLLTPDQGGVARLGEPDRRIGGVLLGALLVLVLLDVVALIADDGGANIGAGLVRLVFLLLVGLATARLAVRNSAARRAR